MIKPDKIIRSNRKTIALVVTPDARILVRAPNETSKEYIEWLLEKKKVWLKQKLAHVIKLNEIHKKKKYVDGEGFPYLGKWIRLRIIKKQDQPFVFKGEPLVFDGNFLYINDSDLPRAGKLIETWYKKRSHLVLTDRVDWFVKCFGFTYTKITITNAQKRWGSCGHNNTLNFSWRLVIAPVEVIDYVVVHELCHTSERNHSENFWIKVKTILPNYLNAIKYLEQNQRVMDI